MKTIFITSFNPFVTRNILCTDVFEILRHAKSAPPAYGLRQYECAHANFENLRLVIFCPDYKKEYFQENFSAQGGSTPGGQKGNVIIEGVKNERVGKQDIIFSYLGRSLIKTKTLAIHRKEIFLRNKNILLYLFSYFLSLVGWLPLFKKFVRRLDQLTISKKKFAAYFDKYKPDLVFAPDIYHIDDAHFLAEAKYRGIFTVGMVRSWDNITNKGLFRIKPDKLIVHNEVIKKEAIKYNDISKKDIFISGLPQFDYYFKYLISDSKNSNTFELSEKLESFEWNSDISDRISRAEFFARIGLNPNKKTILFSPQGRRFYDSDWRILQIIKEAIIGKDLLNVQVLVRLPPNDDMLLGEFIPDENFFIDRPGKQFQNGVFRDQEMTKEEIPHLADSLYHTDLIVGCISTLCIDGIIFGKPSVIIGFDAIERVYLKSMRHYLDFTHCADFLRTGAARVARNKDELIQHIKLYLSRPEADKEGRELLFQDQVWKLDGKSGERIANFIKKNLGFPL